MITGTALSRGGTLLRCGSPLPRAPRRSGNTGHCTAGKASSSRKCLRPRVSLADPVTLARGFARGSPGRRQRMLDQCDQHLLGGFPVARIAYDDGHPGIEVERDPHVPRVVGLGAARRTRRRQESWQYLATRRPTSSATFTRSPERGRARTRGSRSSASARADPLRSVNWRTRPGWYWPVLPAGLRPPTGMRIGRAAGMLTGLAGSFSDGCVISGDPR